MSTTTLISNRFAGHLSAPAYGVPALAVPALGVTALGVPALGVMVTSPATSVHNPTTSTNAKYMTSTQMAWLGGVDESGCFSGNDDTKRITPGRLDRYLT